jgi:divalent metal cation (Fe/Co/Zn/Cd) transporter
LIAVAIFLSVEVKSLLIGESADENINLSVKSIIEDHPEILQLINLITIQQGPGEVLMCLKIKCKPNLTALEISNMINNFEKDIREKNPEVKWIYIEPDLQEWKV